MATPTQDIKLESGPDGIAPSGGNGPTSPTLGGVADVSAGASVPGGALSRDAILEKRENITSSLDPSMAAGSGPLTNGVKRRRRAIEEHPELASLTHNQIVHELPDRILVELADTLKQAASQASKGAMGSSNVEKLAREIWQNQLSGSALHGTHLSFQIKDILGQEALRLAFKELVGALVSSEIRDETLRRSFIESVFTGFHGAHTDREFAIALARSSGATSTTEERTSHLKPAIPFTVSGSGDKDAKPIRSVHSLTFEIEGRKFRFGNKTDQDPNAWIKVVAEATRLKLEEEKRERQWISVVKPHSEVVNQNRELSRELSPEVKKELKGDDFRYAPETDAKVFDLRLIEGENRRKALESIGAYFQVAGRRIGDLQYGLRKPNEEAELSTIQNSLDSLTGRISGLTSGEQSELIYKLQDSRERAAVSHASAELERLTRLYAYYQAEGIDTQKVSAQISSLKEHTVDLAQLHPELVNHFSSVEARVRSEATGEVKNVHGFLDSITVISEKLKEKEQLAMRAQGMSQGTTRIDWNQVMHYDPAPLVNFLRNATKEERGLAARLWGQRHSSQNADILKDISSLSEWIEGHTSTRFIEANSKVVELRQAFSEAPRARAELPAPQLSSEISESATIPFRERISTLADKLARAEALEKRDNALIEKRRKELEEFVSSSTQGLSPEEKRELNEFQESELTLLRQKRAAETLQGLVYNQACAEIALPKSEGEKKSSISTRFQHYLNGNDGANSLLSKAGRAVASPYLFPKRDIYAKIDNADAATLKKAQEKASREQLRKETYLASHADVLQGVDVVEVERNIREHGTNKIARTVERIVSQREAKEGMISTLQESLHEVTVEKDAKEKKLDKDIKELKESGRHTPALEAKMRAVVEDQKNKADEAYHATVRLVSERLKAMNFSSLPEFAEQNLTGPLQAQAKKLLAGDYYGAVAAKLADDLISRSGFLWRNSKNLEAAVDTMHVIGMISNGREKLVDAFNEYGSKIGLVQFDQAIERYASGNKHREKFLKGIASKVAGNVDGDLIAEAADLSYAVEEKDAREVADVLRHLATSRSAEEFRSVLAFAAAESRLSAEAWLKSKFSKSYESGLIEAALAYSQPDGESTSLDLKFSAAKLNYGLERGSNWFKEGDKAAIADALGINDLRMSDGTPLREALLKMSILSVDQKTEALNLREEYYRRRDLVLREAGLNVETASAKIIDSFAHWYTGRSRDELNSGDLIGILKNGHASLAYEFYEATLDQYGTDEERVKSLTMIFSELPESERREAVKEFNEIAARLNDFEHSVLNGARMKKELEKGEAGDCLRAALDAELTGHEWFEVSWRYDHPKPAKTNDPKKDFSASMNYEVEYLNARFKHEASGLLTPILHYGTELSYLAYDGMTGSNYSERNTVIEMGINQLTDLNALNNKIQSGEKLTPEETRKLDGFIRVLHLELDQYRQVKDQIADTTAEVAATSVIVVGGFVQPELWLLVGTGAFASRAGVSYALKGEGYGSEQLAVDAIKSYAQAGTVALGAAGTRLLQQHVATFTGGVRTGLHGESSLIEQALGVQSERQIYEAGVKALGAKAAEMSPAAIATAGREALYNSALRELASQRILAESYRNMGQAKIMKLAAQKVGREAAKKMSAEKLLEIGERALREQASTTLKLLSAEKITAKAFENYGIQIIQGSRILSFGNTVFGGATGGGLLAVTSPSYGDALDEKLWRDYGIVEGFHMLGEKGLDRATGGMAVGGAVSAFFGVSRLFKRQDFEVQARTELARLSQREAELYEKARQLKLQSQQVKFDTTFDVTRGTPQHEMKFLTSDQAKQVLFGAKEKVEQMALGKLTDVESELAQIAVRKRALNFIEQSGTTTGKEIKKASAERLKVLKADESRLRKVDKVLKEPTELSEGKIQKLQLEKRTLEDRILKTRQEHLESLRGEQALSRDPRNANLARSDAQKAKLEVRVGEAEESLEKSREAVARRAAEKEEIIKRSFLKGQEVRSQGSYTKLADTAEHASQKAQEAAIKSVESAAENGVFSVSPAEAAKLNSAPVTALTQPGAVAGGSASLLNKAKTVMHTVSAGARVAATVSGAPTVGMAAASSEALVAEAQALAKAPAAIVQQVPARVAPNDFVRIENPNFQARITPKTVTTPKTIAKPNTTLRQEFLDARGGALAVGRTATSQGAATGTHTAQSSVTRALKETATISSVTAQHAEMRAAANLAVQGEMQIAAQSTEKALESLLESKILAESISYVVVQNQERLRLNQRQTQNQEATRAVTKQQEALQAKQKENEQEKRKGRHPNSHHGADIVSTKKKKEGVFEQNLLDEPHKNELAVTKTKREKQKDIVRKRSRKFNEKTGMVEDNKGGFETIDEINKEFIV